MPLFTAETAVIAAKLSHAPTSARHKPRIELEPPNPPPIQPQPDIAPAVEPADAYGLQVLARTRMQLDLVADRILEELRCKEPDSRRLRDLSDAQRHLAEQERILAGRPLPGSRRPGPVRQHRQVSEIEPLPSPAGTPPVGQADSI